jgi:hypothetical protein
MLPSEDASTLVILVVGYLVEIATIARLNILCLRELNFLYNVRGLCVISLGIWKQSDNVTLW